MSLLRGIVSRALPQAGLDNLNSGTPVRLSRYGEFMTVGSIRKQHALADEGSYFVFNSGNPATGVATAAAPTSFSDTAPLLTIFNTDSPGNQNNKRIHLDFLRFTCTAAGTAGVSFRIGVKIGQGSAYSSGGTVYTPQSPNMDSGKNSIAHVAILPTAVAMTGQPRTIVGDVYVIPTLAAVFPVGAQFLLHFGGVEPGSQTAVIASTTATMVSSAVALPPVSIGPGQSAVLLHLITSQSAASSWSVEGGIWER